MCRVSAKLKKFFFDPPSTTTTTTTIRPSQQVGDAPGTPRLGRRRLHTEINAAKFQQNHKTSFFHSTTTHPSIRPSSRKRIELPRALSLYLTLALALALAIPLSLPLSLSLYLPPSIPRSPHHSLSPPFLSLSEHFASLVKMCLLQMGILFFFHKKPNFDNSSWIFFYLKFILKLFAEIQRIIH